MAPRSQKVLILLIFISLNFEKIFIHFPSTFHSLSSWSINYSFPFSFNFSINIYWKKFFNENIGPLGKRKGEREREINNKKLRNIEGLRKGNMENTNTLFIYIKGLFNFKE